MRKIIEKLHRTRFDGIVSVRNSHPAQPDFGLKGFAASFQLIVNVLDISGHLLKAPDALDESLSRLQTLPVF